MIVILRAAMSPWYIVLLLMFTNTMSADDRLNVLFVAVDDMNCLLGCYGNPDVSSPHIDALARRGVLFERAYCQQAVCNPSRASVMTGLRPDTVKVWDLRTDFRAAVPDAVTLPQLFKQNGYHTQNIGKIYHNMGDLNDEPSWSVPSMMHEGRHSDDYQLPANRRGERTGKGPYFERGDLPDDAYLDGKIAEAAAMFLQERASNPDAQSIRDASPQQPFFLAVGFWRPHLPFLAPEPYWQRYETSAQTPGVSTEPQSADEGRSPIHGQRRRSNETPGVSASFTLPDTFTPPRNVPGIALHDSRELFGYGGVDRDNVDDLRRQLWLGYFAGISYVDAQVGRVIAALDESGLAERTVIVFWSDHGFHLGQHSLWCKTSCFELDARVPLIIVPPKTRQAGRRRRAIVELLDMYPTLAELCGLEAPANLEGRSLVPLLEDPSVDWPYAALTQHPRPAYYKGEPEAMGYSLRTDRYRYTEWRNWQTGEVVARELYDHEIDADETMNVADDPAYSTVVLDHQHALGEHR